jgi:hypothetical protein
MNDVPVTAEDASALLELRHAATDRVNIVVVPERRLFAIDGVGGPRGSDFRLASEVLRSAAENLRATLHQRRGIESRIGVIEVAWWIHPEPAPTEMAEAFADRAKWHWQQMVEVADRATDEEAEAAIDVTRAQAGRDIPLLRLIHFTEGRAAQILQVAGPEAEAAAIARLYDAVAGLGLRVRGHLHQIVLADPDRVPAGRSRSIFRLPIEPA